MTPSRKSNWLRRYRSFVRDSAGFTPDSLKHNRALGVLSVLLWHVGALIVIGGPAFLWPQDRFIEGNLVSMGGSLVICVGSAVNLSSWSI